MATYGDAICPMHADFDPLSPTFLADPFAILASLPPDVPMFYAPLIGCYFVTSLTFPLPTTVIFSFLGIPERDWQQLKQWCGHRASLAWGRPTPTEQVHHAENMAGYRGYLRAFVARKIPTRDDTFTSALLEIHAKEPDALAQEEITSILYSLTFAGHEATNYL